VRSKGVNDFPYRVVYFVEGDLVMEGRCQPLSSLKAATHSGNYAARLAALAFARRWTARVDFTKRETAEAELNRTHALRDAREAEDASVRLTLP
jgi:hypothetical protein